MTQLYIVYKRVHFKYNNIGRLKVKGGKNITCKTNRKKSRSGWYQQQMKISDQRKLPEKYTNIKTDKASVH
jgi:hypothetical protein